jgi:phosphoribosyl 1,2-cyclic phosphodiesterase/CheY-like chemotaxis protein
LFYLNWCENLRAVDPMHTLLLIDDDRDARFLMARLLKKAGWEVLEAEDGFAGLEMMAKHHPEAVLCDLMMPRCNGFQFCRSVRERGTDFPQPKIIIATASDYASDRSNAMEAGADEVLIKPVKLDDLLKIMGRIASKGDQPDIEVTSAPPAAPAEGPRTPPVAAAEINPENREVLVKFWGVRGSIPTPGPTTALYGGNTTCVEVRADGELIILDAGTGIRPLGLQLISEFKGTPLNLTVLMTHTHWDHIQGFPFFIPAYNPKNQLRILGYEGARKGLENTLSSQMESPYFPISMQQMPGNISIQELREMNFTVGRVQVQAQFMNHPGVCVGYRLNTSAGAIAFLPDNEPFQRLKAHSGSQAGPDQAAAQEYARKQDDKLISFLRDVDVLIMDAQYDATEYPQRVGWGHACVDDTVAIALSAKVKRLFLFHHDPGHDDAYVARMEAHARALVAQSGGSLIVEAAREGSLCVLVAGKKTA